MAVPFDVDPPSRLGARYELGAELGRGGMGIVYRAHDSLLGRPVALKVMTDEANHDRFLAEAQRTAQIRDPAVVEVFDVATDAGRGYIVMELLEGETLDALLARNGPLEPEVAIAIGSRICNALMAAHALEIVHRDIKPANVFLPRGGEAKVLDFGIAKKIDSRTMRTDPSMLVGTLTYMAPEQIRGAEVDGRADLYALGVLLFKALAGRPPFEGETVAVIHQHLDVAPPRLRTLAPRVSGRLEDLVQRLLAKEPAARPKDAETARKLLQAALEPDDEVRRRPEIELDEDPAPVRLELMDVPRHHPLPPPPPAPLVSRFEPTPLASPDDADAPVWLVLARGVSPELSKRVAGYSAFLVFLDVVFFGAKLLPLVCFSLLALVASAAYVLARRYP